MMTTNTKFRGFVGTYTKGDSKGIYAFTLDTEAGKITEVKAAAELGNPTYLNISTDNQYLYSIIKEGEAGGIAAYSINNQTAELTPVNKQLLPGSSPCHVSIGHNNKLLFSANYHKAEVISYTINPENGAINPPVSIMKHEGSGPDYRQEKAHTHFAEMTPDGKYLAVMELGSDFLITYELIGDGHLTEVQRLKLRPGTGPRHLVFHPNQKYAYIMSELSSEVIVLAYHTQDGSFSILQKVSTIPDDFTENNQGSAIHISSDGRFIYVQNRGHNSIVVFSADQKTGKVTWVEHVSSEGNWPRDFALDPTEKFLVSSNQESHNLVLYARDTDTGKLTLLQSDVAVPSPVCIKFLHIVK